MSETMTSGNDLYDLVMGAMKSPLPEPWITKKVYQGGADTKGRGRYAEIVFDHPKYTALLRCYKDVPAEGGDSGGEYAYGSVQAFRKDAKRPCHEEMVHVL